MKSSKELSSKIHIFGTGFIGKNIGRRIKETSTCDVQEYTKQKFDLTSSSLDSGFINISNEDKIVFSAAKAPCRTLSDLRYNLLLLEKFISVLEEFEFSYILNISSDAVYADSAYPIDEDANASPQSLHGLMHLTRERSLEAAFPGKVGHLRPTLVYGFDDPHNGYGPNQFIRSALRGQSINLYGKGEEIRDHIYIEDVSVIGEYMLLKSHLGILNGVSGNAYSFEDVASMVTRLVQNSSITYVARKGPMPHNGYRVFDNKSLKNLELQSFPTPLETGLKEMIRKSQELLCQEN